ncbi:MAG: DegT/DnrJ/EryC1/StrS family aminotransferase [Acidobacteria bacterium]|nr:DegT/DnrJ/EryC1/StrS family aminotransferase [Acidobacteriota bacterium]MCI0719059.1 DegT/DnrJ/EryC1/StrS family aminotransferase [Acidobacteriota bacterium]
MRLSRRDFVRSGVVAAAAVAAKGAAAKPRRVEFLAVNGGLKAITLPDDRHAAAIKWPRYGEEEKRRVLELLDNNRFYDEIPQLEQATREYLGVSHVKAHCNGTSALVSMFFALDLPKGSEILVPSYTAWATVAPMWLFGYVPVFVDINPRTACFDLASAERQLTRQCRALVVMHAWGLPCEMEQICDFGRKHGLIVLEDAAQAQGATLRGKQMGSWGAIGVFSFQASKVLPAVEGGMGVYQTPEYFERATTFGNYDLPGKFPAESPYRGYQGTGFGSKFRIHPIAAALARTQLRGLDQRNALIAAEVRKLNDRLTQLPGLSEQQAAPEMRRVHWAANLLFFDEAAAGFSKEILLKALKAEGVRASGAPYDEQHQYRLYSEAKWWHHPPQIPSLPGCKQVNKSSVRLPLFTESASDLIDQYTKAFEKIWAHRDALGKS